ncbi:MAG: molybdenum cofactor biosynthesis protein MoeB [Euryarchaeota archaeon]|nr:molybdenum cofactor biosynthesis protein MoeB [Euryarchaeota archaeon]
MVDINRYARHISLPQIGIQGQKNISKSNVLVIGAGGLGSPAILYLAAAGVGRIGIIDFDDVDISNLQRQVIHSNSAVGQNKAESAKNRIKELNPEVEVVIWKHRLTPENAIEIFQDGWDIVVDGTDNLPTRYLIDDLCSIIDLPWVYGSIYRFEGQVSVFNFNGGPSYRDLFPEPPPTESVPSCADGGVLGVLPGVIGSIQATEAIKMITGVGQLLSGKLLIYDAENMNFNRLNFEKVEDRKQIQDLSLAMKMFVDEGWCQVKADSDNRDVEKPSTAEQNNMFQNITPADCVKRRNEGWSPFLLDVRSKQEYEQVRISFTDMQIAHEEVLSVAQSLPKDRDILLLCRSGMRSQMAALFLMDCGFDGNKLFNIEGGILLWSQTSPADIE